MSVVYLHTITRKFPSAAGYPLCRGSVAIADGSPDREMGERIRNLRIEKGLNRQQLGALIGISGQQMQKYESAKNSLSVAKLLVIARVLGVPVGYLIPDMEGQHESLSHMYLQFIRNSKALEAAEPKVFMALCKMTAVAVKLLEKRDI